MRFFSGIISWTNKNLKNIKPKFFGNIILALYNNQALVGLFQKPINDLFFLTLFIGLICLDVSP